MAKAKKRPKKWMQSVTSSKSFKKGALTAAAKRAGKSIPAFCAQGNLSTTNKRRCNLAKRFQAANR